jgi:hypothetical protein
MISPRLLVNDTGPDHRVKLGTSCQVCQLSGQAYIRKRQPELQRIMNLSV